MEELKTGATSAEGTSELSDADIESLVSEAIGGKNTEIQDDSTAETAKKTPAPRTSGAKPANEEIGSQRDFNTALNRRLQEERGRLSRRYEDSPAYRVGQQLLADRMEREGLTEEEAMRKIIDERADALADRYAKDPKAYYRDQVAGKLNPKPKPKSPSDEGDDDSTTEIRDTRNTGEVGKYLAQEAKAGRLPEGFGRESITPEFIEDVEDMGIRAALRLWERTNSGAPAKAAPQKGGQPTREEIIAELERRQKQANPIRVNGGNVEPRQRDFSPEHMSKEEFRKADEALERALKGR